MNPLQTNMLNALVGAAVALSALGAAVPARADAFAQSILVIDNLRLRHANGTSLTAGDFAQLTESSVAHAGAQFNGVFANDVQAGRADIAQQGVGAAARAENDFAPFARPAFEDAGYSSADQNMAGAMIAGADGGGALLQLRADASLTGAGAAMANSGLVGATTFTFELGADEFMTISFDALAFTQAFLTDSDGAAIGASAHLAWSISVRDLSTGATVFTFQPEQLNAMGNVSRSGGLTGATTYDPGWQSFAATTGLLTGGDTYQVTIAQSTFASALQSQPMAEPGTLSGIGAGLLAMAALSRRRRRARPPA
ncbi:MAG: EDSAP-1 family PEP-CTERM protein [Pseudomonadota bacterium]